MAPPPKIQRDSSRRMYTQNNGTPDPFKEDLFGSVPFNPATKIAKSVEQSSPASDPFGMDDFGCQENVDPSQQELENAIGLLDKRILEMKVFF